MSIRKKSLKSTMNGRVKLRKSLDARQKQVRNYPSPIPRHFRGALDKRDAKVVAETVIKIVKETGVARI